MAISVEECLHFADQIEQMAGRTVDAEARLRMLDIGRTWRLMAQQMTEMPEPAGD